MNTYLSCYIEGETPLLRLVRKVMPFLDMEEGPWLAGGAARLLYQQYEDDDLGPSDLDIFFPSQTIYDWTLKFMQNFPPDFLVSVNDIGYGHSVKFVQGETIYQVQLIRKYFHETVESLMSNFDFTITMFASDGYQIMWDERAKRDLETNSLVNVRKAKKPTPLRLAKYCLHNFNVAPGVMSELLGANLPDFEFEDGLVFDEY